MPTVEDTRIDEIGKIILDHRYEKDPRDMNALKYSSYLIAKKILEYMAPTIEKAEKWDRVKEIASSDYCSRCFNRFKCPSDDYAPCPFKDILEEVEGEKDDRA